VCVLVHRPLPYAPPCYNAFDCSAYAYAIGCILHRCRLTGCTETFVGATLARLQQLCLLPRHLRYQSPSPTPHAPETKILHMQWHHTPALALKMKSVSAHCALNRPCFLGHGATASPKMLNIIGSARAVSRTLTQAKHVQGQHTRSHACCRSRNLLRCKVCFQDHVCAGSNDTST
jgi:hypothetical protein